MERACCVLCHLKISVSRRDMRPAPSFKIKIPSLPRYTLIARKFVDVLSDENITNPLTSCFVGAIIALWRGERAKVSVTIEFAMTPSRKEKKMYTKDKANRITLRLNDDQFDFVKSNADFLGVSPSEFLRMVINASMATTKSALEKLENIVEEGDGRENDKANSDNII